MVQMNLFPGQKQRCRRREMDMWTQEGEGEAGVNWEVRTDTHTHHHEAEFLKKPSSSPEFLINLSMQSFTHFLDPYTIPLKIEQDQRKGGIVTEQDPMRASQDRAL